MCQGVAQESTTAESMKQDAIPYAVQPEKGKLAVPLNFNKVLMWYGVEVNGNLCSNRCLRHFYLMLRERARERGTMSI